MFGIILGLLVLLTLFYMLFFKVYPAMFFRYWGGGERKGRAEYQRIKREHPDAPEALKSEAEFVEAFVSNGPSPWRRVALLALIALLGLPMSCAIGVATMGN